MGPPVLNRTRGGNHRPGSSSGAAARSSPLFILISSTAASLLEPPYVEPASRELDGGEQAGERRDHIAAARVALSAMGGFRFFAGAVFGFRFFALPVTIYITSLSQVVLLVKS